MRRRGWCCASADCSPRQRWCSPAAAACTAAVCAQRKHDVHLFPSGVDTAHYASSRALRRPHERRVAGYVGVIDERLDLELIAELADHLPDWTIRMVGPVAKIDESLLPRRANLEYAGMTPYSRAAAGDGRLRRGADAVRPERGDPIHQPYQDPGVPGGRPAGGFDQGGRRGRRLQQRGASGRRRCRIRRRRARRSSAIGSLSGTGWSARWSRNSNGTTSPPRCPGCWNRT